MTTTLYSKKKCSRCPRADEIEMTLEQALEASKNTRPKPPQLKIIMEGQSVVEFEHLCAPCTEIVSSFIGNAARQPMKVSSTRERKIKEPKPKKEKKETAPT
jgi:hypothetical protein